MSISKKQLKANKRNAQLGGVKTEKGRQRIKYNAMKHGLLAKHLVIEDSEKSEYIKLSSTLYEELDPKTEIERILVERVIVNVWRMRRCLKIELELMTYQKNDTLLDVDLMDNKEQSRRAKQISMLDSPMIEKLLRYEVMMEKGLFKALNELLHIQSNS